MIVVVILGIIAGGVALAVFPQLAKAKIAMTRTNAKTMRSAASIWRSEHTEGACPVPAQLRDAELLDTGSKLADEWGTPFQIACHETQTVVISLGPDRKESPDDIVEPEPVAMATAM